MLQSCSLKIELPVSPFLVGMCVFEWNINPGMPGYWHSDGGSEVTVTQGFSVWRLNVVGSLLKF